MTDAEAVESAARTTIVVVGGEATPTGELAALLAKDFELVTFEVPPPGAADVLAASIARLALPRYALLAFEGASEAALRCAAGGDPALARVLLIAPDALRGADDAQRLAPLFASLAAPVLVAFGNDDARSAFGRHYRAAIRRSHFSLIHAAGPDVAAERPAALAVLIADFIRRGARFVLPDESLAVQP